jgi:hypothetical protein
MDPVPRSAFGPVHAATPRRPFTGGAAPGSPWNLRIWNDLALAERLTAPFTGSGSRVANVHPGVPLSARVKPGS